MKFEGFLHLNIRCSPEDIPAIERFYGDVLGLKTGYRPDFKFAGIWALRRRRPRHPRQRALPAGLDRKGPA